jgi:8-amino-7-oxononanoate synthase
MLTLGKNLANEGKAAFPQKYFKQPFFEKLSRFHEFYKAYMINLGTHNPYTRVVDPPSTPIVQKSGKTLVMLGSNNYLGLSTHPAVKKAAKMAIDSFGTGACSSRPLAGTTSLHVQLEKELSDFKGTEATLLFSTGYMTMMGTISALAGEDDIIFSDQLNHASIIDGIRLSRAQVKIYKHNDMTSLEENLADSDSEANKLIVTDGVFSMMGDVANLPEIKKLADKYNAFVMVDDAHGTGVLGKSGRGILELYNMENQIEIAGSTFSKVFGTVGGAIGARKEIIDFLRFNSRPFIFTASLPPSVIATVLASLRLLRSSPQLLKRLRKNVKFVRENLTGLNFRLAPTQTPIIPLLIGDDVKTMRMATELEEEGVFVNPVIPPAVSVEASLIRISVMASLSQEELEFAVGKFKIIGKRIGLI